MRMATLVPSLRAAPLEGWGETVYSARERCIHRQTLLRSDLGTYSFLSRGAGVSLQSFHHATDKRGVDVVIENVGAATWKDSVR
jgi:hypothetical protein